MVTNFFVAETEHQFGCVEGLPVHEKMLLHFGGEAAPYEFEHETRVGTVELVADNGMAQMRGVDADLVRSTGAREGADERKSTPS